MFAQIESQTKHTQKEKHWNDWDLASNGRVYLIMWRRKKNIMEGKKRSENLFSHWNYVIICQTVKMHASTQQNVYDPHTYAWGQKRWLCTVCVRALCSVVSLSGWVFWSFILVAFTWDLYLKCVALVKEMKLCVRYSVGTTTDAVSVDWSMSKF